MKKQKIAVLFSGGKDSCLALFKVMEDKKYDVRFLLNVLPENKDSFMFHKPDENLLEKQAEMLGMTLVVKESKGEEATTSKSPLKEEFYKQKTLDAGSKGSINADMQNQSTNGVGEQVGETKLKNYQGANLGEEVGVLPNNFEKDFINEEKRELQDLERLLSLVSKEIQGVVVGGIASNYQGKRIKKICDKLGLKFIAPLWDYSAENIWKELLQNKFKVILTKISCEGLDRKWIGKIIGKREFEELKKLEKKFGFQLDFEGGEAESAVLWMPGFRKEIKIKFNIKSEGEYRHFLKIKRIE